MSVGDVCNDTTSQSSTLLPKVGDSILNDKPIKRTRISYNNIFRRDSSGGAETKWMMDGDTKDGIKRLKTVINLDI